MSWEEYYCGIGALEGKIISKIERIQDEEILFTTACGNSYKMYHEQDCCEDVQIEDVCGDLEDLVGQKVLRATEESGEIEDAYESGTWTFYVIDTFNSSVTVRWNGESNGYYSESVDFVDMNKSAY